MELTTKFAEYQRRAFLALSVPGFIAAAGFSVANYITANTWAMWINIVMALIVVGGMLALLNGAVGKIVYRVVCGGISIALYCQALTETGHLYYHLIVPVLLFFVLSRREAVVWSGGFLLGLIAMLLTPGLLDDHVQQTDNALRFTSCYLFVSVVAWLRGRFQESISEVLNLKNEELRNERKNLRTTLDRMRNTESQLEESHVELKERTRLLHTILNSMNEGVVVVNSAGQMLFGNSSSTRIAGMEFQPSKLNEWPQVYGIFHRDKETYVSMDENPLMKALQGESTDGFQAFLRNDKVPDGTSLVVTARPIRSTTSDEITGGLIMFRDVTDQRKAEIQLEQTLSDLQEQSDLMNAIFNSVNDGLVVTDTRGEFRFVNPVAQEISGMGPTDTSPDHSSETYGTYFPDGKTIFPSDQLPLVRAIRGESTDDVEVLIRNPQRPEGVHISVNGRPLLDDSGNLKGGIIVLRDITRLKQTERELKQTADRLRSQTHATETVLNSISDGVVAVNEYGEFTVYNPSAERMYGIGRSTKSPNHWPVEYGIFYPDQVTRFSSRDLPLVRAIQGESTDNLHMFIRNSKVPEGIHISVTGRPLQDDSGVTKGGVCVVRDVTQQALAEEALTEAFAQGRLEVVHTILHNIGNAVNSVSIGVGSIREQLANNRLVRRLRALAKALEAHQGDWISYLQTDTQGKQVLPFIIALSKDFLKENELLQQTAERVESRVAHIVEIVRTQRMLGTDSIVHKVINFRRAVTDAVKIQQESLDKRGISIRVNFRGVPEEIRIQESRFQQMLVNLIKNAIEAIDALVESKNITANPCIEVRSYVDEEFLIIDVTDTGIGIEHEVSKLIFKAGYSTKKTGSGLGLHSAANFAIGSGGNIQALSAGIGGGTTMRVKLRLIALTQTNGRETGDKRSPEPQ